jgi:predicted methyltransferase
VGAYGQEAKGRGVDNFPLILFGEDRMQSLSKMNMVVCAMARLLMAALVSTMAFFYVPARAEQNTLARWVAVSHRTAGNVARDGFRHPLETLAFFGIKGNSTVVEILPGSGGYYMEILAPYLKARGRYIAANRDEAAAPRYLADHQKLLARLKAEPALYEKVFVTKFNADKHEIASQGSADFVLTFRNLHNWVERNEIDGALRAFHRALKLGGVLGVVDHRGRADMSQEAQMKSGYVRQDFAIAVIEKAGFRLAGAAEVNQCQFEGYERPPRRSVDVASVLSPEGQGSRQIPGDRRK